MTEDIEQMAEQAIHQHIIGCAAMHHLLTYSIALFGSVHVLGKPFGGCNVVEAVETLRGLLPPVYSCEPNAMIELSAFAHQTAKRDAQSIATANKIVGKDDDRNQHG